MVIFPLLFAPKVGSATSIAFSVKFTLLYSESLTPEFTGLQYILNNPELIYKTKKDQYQNLLDKLNINIKNNLNNNTNKYLLLINKLETLNPLSTIKRGYSIVRKDNKVISSIKNVKKDEVLELELIDGKINTKVI